VELERTDYQNRNHLLLIANGYMGVRSSFGELFTVEDSSIHIIGLYDQLGYNDPHRDPWHPERDKWKEIINVPNFMLARLAFNGEAIVLNDKNHSDFHAALDLQTATMRLEYVWKSKKGQRLKVVQERFCAYHQKNLAWNTLTATSLDGDGELRYDAGIAGEVADANGPHLVDFTSGECDGGYWLRSYTQQHRYEIAISSKHQVSGAKTGVRVKIAPGEKEIRQVFTLPLKKSQPVQIVSQHAVYTSRDSHDPLAEAQAARFDLAAERAAHLQGLREHWDACNVEIDGDEKAQKYLRYNLYILLVSIPKDFDYASIPSRSLSAQTYKGAIFWEVDTYAFAFYAYVFPEYAKNLLLYRYKCLMYALKKSIDLGYEGAFYAWESLDTGEEATKKLVWRDIHSGRMMRNYFGDRQYHIAGDVIFAAWQYYQATGDWQFMLDYGAEMTLLVARFIGSLVYYKKTKDRYEILHTVCPDEYHEEVDNNVFTNRILRFVLEKTFELIKLLEQRSPQTLERLLGQLKIAPEELDYWKDVARKMYLKAPNEKFVIEQFDGYFTLEDITLAEFKSRIIKDEYLGHQIGPAPLTQIVKQADVVQLLVMFKSEYHPIVRKATFDYYEPRTEHGSGDSPNAYGIVAAQVGERETAYDYFLRSARIDLESTNPKKKANFFLGGVHIAPSGGTWQVIALGFAGLELRDNVIRFNPVLPAHWRRVRFRFVIQGQLLTVTMDQKQITVASSRDNQLELTVQASDQPPVALRPGAETTAAYKKMGRHYYIY